MTDWQDEAARRVAYFLCGNIEGEPRCVYDPDANVFRFLPRVTPLIEQWQEIAIEAPTARPHNLAQFVADLATDYMRAL